MRMEAEKASSKTHAFTWTGEYLLWSLNYENCILYSGDNGHNVIFGILTVNSLNYEYFR